MTLPGPAAKGNSVNQFEERQDATGDDDAIDRKVMNLQSHRTFAQI